MRQFHNIVTDFALNFDLISISQYISYIYSFTGSIFRKCVAMQQPFWKQFIHF